MTLDNFKKILIGLVSTILLMTMLNTCNSCNTKKAAKRTQYELDSLKTEFKVFKEQEENSELDFNRAKLLLEKEGLKTELRMLINTNQIFLTRKRPDKRVLEIQEELKKIEEKELNNGKN